MKKRMEGGTMTAREKEVDKALDNWKGNFIEDLQAVLRDVKRTGGRSLDDYMADQVDAYGDELLALLHTEPDDSRQAVAISPTGSEMTGILHVRPFVRSGTKGVFTPEATP